MVEDLKRISESREIAQASTLTHNTIEYEGKNNCCFFKGAGKTKNMAGIAGN
jgi:hypothetical protein